MNPPKNKRGKAAFGSMVFPMSIIYHTSRHMTTFFSISLLLRLAVNGESSNGKQATFKVKVQSKDVKVTKISIQAEKKPVKKGKKNND